VATPPARAIDLDTTVDALLVRTGNPRWDYGALATVRSLGLLGVHVHVLADSSEPELLRSRFAASGLGPALDPQATVEESTRRLNEVAARISRPVFAIAGDDESAVLLAEQRARLHDSLLTFDLPASLPRRLSSKASLSAICADAAVPYPESAASDRPADLIDFATDLGFPVIVKAPEPFARLHESNVMRTQVVTSRTALADLVEQWPVGRPMLVQQFLDPDRVEYWYSAGLAGRNAPSWGTFTGRKEVAYPTRTGVGTYSVAIRNPTLAQLTRELCEYIGFNGPFDSDWAHDPTTGRTWLIDFNPRRGAQFRLFTTTTGLDILRAAHLSLTGRPVPWGEQVTPRSHSVGNLNVLVARQWIAARKAAGHPSGEGAWWYRRDRGPAVAVGASFVGTAARKVGRIASSRLGLGQPDAGATKRWAQPIDRVEPTVVKHQAS
jgi:predicted ATP-grasp superfamily ATP-dependent carboligase